jgi:mannosyl-oligosaccharide alpha-1,2-mannosidase
MLRYRRYRVFLFFTAVLIFLVYTLTTPAKWEETAHTVDHVREQLGLDKKTNSQRPHQEPLQTPDAKPPVEKQSPPPIEPIPKPMQQLPPTKVENPTVSQAHPPIHPSAIVIQDSAEDGRQRVVAGGVPGEVITAVIAEAGEGRKEEDLLPADAVLLRWEPPEEHFPLAETIQVPVGTSKPIPKIQHGFEKESSVERKTRLERLEIIKAAFLHAWNSYKENAWGKDELTPVTASYKNPFNGWGATLVDSLDTLWIMGLKKEFEEAVATVKLIDFRTSRRSDIPLFETVIRYLGGLLGAYDVSGGKYRTLLDKAVQLGEMLIGAFDTPNRMPVTFYQWKP